MSIRIPLSRGLFAVVDDADYEELSRHQWSAIKPHNTFYAVRAVGKTFIYMHRAILGATSRKEYVDHRDGDGLNNQRSNLRLCSQSQNAMNRSRLDSNNTSGFRGVTWCKRKQRYQALIQTKGKNKFLGHFASARDAAAAYDEASALYHGDFGKTNRSMGLL